MNYFYNLNISYIARIIVVALFFGASFGISHLRAESSQSSIVGILEKLDSLNQEIATIQASHANIQKIDSLIDQKQATLEVFLTKITDSKTPIGIDITQNQKQKQAQNILLTRSEIVEDDYDVILAKITLASLDLEQNMNDAIVALRKNIDFFSQQEKIINIIKPFLDATKALPQDFSQIDSLKLESKQLQTLQVAKNDYLLKLVTYTQALEYINQNTQKIVAQNAFGISMEWIIKKISTLLPMEDSNFLFSKILLSLLTFIVLWFCRKFVARFIVWLINLSFHLAKQDSATRAKIQKDISKPISLFLFFFSVNISVNILYYPLVSPAKLEVWFDIAYIANFAWFFIMALQGYAGIFIANLAQKSENNFRKEVVNLILKIIYFIIIIFAILAVLKILGFNISAIIASLGLGGLAVALAVKDMLANFFASVMLLFDNSFSQGDLIECSGASGTVVEMGLRRTTIRTTDNGLVLIPNSELANKAITNWSRRKAGRMIKLMVRLSYGTPKDKIELYVNEIKKMLLANPKIAKTSDQKDGIDYSLLFKKDIISIDDYLGYKGSIYVLVDALADDGSINILVQCFSKTTALEECLNVKQEVILEIMKITQACNISFASSSQSIYIENFPPKA